MKILVAEDDPTATLILQQALTKGGHEVVAFGTGMEAWKYQEEDPVRLIITDWMMPEMAGVDLVKKVRAAQLGSPDYTYMIILTALAGREYLLEALEAGVDDFMTKPVDLPELNARIKVAERIIGLRQEVKQLEGLLSICSYCKKIREGDGWTQLESYVQHRSDASFSHGVCPTCYETKVLPQIEGA